MSRWPKDNQTALIKFYGDPGKEEPERQLVKVTPPFKMYYESVKKVNGKLVKTVKLVNTISFHKKAAPALEAALNKIWDYYDHDQATIDRHEISKYAGTYNPRYVRGTEKTTKKWSNHAYGAAIDLDAEDNGFGAGKGDLPAPVIAAFKSEGAAWGGDYKGRTDPMHFEFCDRGEPQRGFDEWLRIMGVKVAGKTAVALPVAAFKEDFADPEPPTATAAKVAVPPSEATVQGDEELWNVQRRLKAMAYNPGGLDGEWGSMTTGAIGGFISDRGLKIAAPTTFEMFQAVKGKIKSEIAAAEVESFTRPIALERANATSEVVAEKIETIDASKASADASKTSKVWTWILGIPAAITAFVKGIADNFQAALESPMLSTIKEFFADNVLYIALGVVGVAGIIWFKSREAENESKKAEDGTVRAFQEGRLS